MVIPTLNRNHHGRNSHHPSGPGGHLRPLNHHPCTAHVLWAGLLDDVGHGLGEGDNSCNLCHIQLSDRQNQGEEK